MLLLYEGHQIYFGRAGDAKGYFENLGFDCPESQTVADYLTSVSRIENRDPIPPLHFGNFGELKDCLLSRDNWSLLKHFEEV